MQSSYKKKTKNNNTIVNTSIQIGHIHISRHHKDDVIDQQFELSSIRNTCDERADSSVIII